MELNRVVGETGLSKTAIRIYYKSCMEENLGKTKHSQDYTEQEIRILKYIRKLRLLGFELNEIQQMFCGEPLQPLIEAKLSEYQKQDDRQNEVECLQNILQGNDLECMTLKREILEKRMKKQKEAKTDNIYFGILNLILLAGVVLYEVWYVQWAGLEISLGFDRMAGWALLALQILFLILAVVFRLKRRKENQTRLSSRGRTVLEAMIELLASFLTYIVIAIGTKAVYALEVIHGTNMAGQWVFLFAAIVCILLIVCLLYLPVHDYRKTWCEFTFSEEEQKR